MLILVPITLIQFYYVSLVLLNCDNINWKELRSWKYCANLVIVCAVTRSNQFSALSGSASSIPQCCSAHNAENEIEMLHEMLLCLEQLAICFFRSHLVLFPETFRYPNNFHFIAIILLPHIYSLFFTRGEFVDRIYSCFYLHK